MRWTILISLVAACVAFGSSCQLSVEDINPVHMRGGGESPESEPEPKHLPRPEPPRKAGQDVVYVLGLNGID